MGLQHVRAGGRYNRACSTGVCKQAMDMAADFSTQEKGRNEAAMPTGSTGI